MKKICFSKFGGPDVLELAEVDEPQAASGQIRISVKAAAVNAIDWRIREGQMQTVNPIKLPAGIGQDAAGIVDEIGAGVDDVKVGDFVFGTGSSTYAESAVLVTWATIPQGISFEEAAGYPSVMETALRVIEEVGIHPGQVLLVSGASGGVGSAVLQIARSRGIHVIGIGAADNQDYLRSLGASPTTYDDGWVDRVRQIGQVNAALDLAGSGVIAELIELTGRPDRVVSTADLRAPELGAHFSSKAGDMTRALAETVKLLDRREIHIPTSQTYSLEDAAKAQVASQNGHTRGRRIIVI